MVAVDEDTLLLRLDSWSKNLANLAKSICHHGAEGTDSRGHQARPCQWCMKTVRHVTEYWWMAMHIKAKAAVAKAEKDGLALPQVNLFEALYIASSLLDPCTSVTLPDWGAA